MKVVQILGLMVVIASSASVAQASLITYTVNNPGGSDGYDSAGDITKVETSYDTSSGDFTWSYDITTPAPGTNKVNDAFWLVVSDGDNPKGTPDELAILYGDLDTGILTAYQYNGVNGNDSYKETNAFLETFENAIVVDDSAMSSQTVSFSIDVSSLNTAVSSSAWKGAQFGDEIGIWFHPSAGSTIYYQGDLIAPEYCTKPKRNGTCKNKDLVDGYTYKKQGWYDTSGQPTITHEVPEPAGIALLAAGALGFGFARRKRRSVA